jgi:tRNA G18 (ribose-2'-O)-methylase SpoU
MLKNVFINFIFGFIANNGKTEIAKIITAVTGDQIVVGELEPRQALEHFLLPDAIFLELLELVLNDPTQVLVENLQDPKNLSIVLSVGKQATSLRCCEDHFH